MARILIVDDDADVREVVAEMLEALGHETFRADAGMAALVMVDVVRPDLVILDVAMPELSGDAVLDRVRREHPDLPVVVLTGMVNPAIEADMRRRGAVGYLTKPADMDAFARQVDAALAGRKGVDPLDTVDPGPLRGEE